MPPPPSIPPPPPPLLHYQSPTSTPRPRFLPLAFLFGLALPWIHIWLTGAVLENITDGQWAINRIDDYRLLTLAALLPTPLIYWAFGRWIRNRAYWYGLTLSLIPLAPLVGWALTK